MSAGLLDKVLEIQTYTESESGGYKTNKVWSTIATVRGQLIPVSGLVTMDSMQIGQKITHKVYMRFYPGLTSEHWLLIEARRFRIRTVITQLERRRFMELLCEEEFPSSKTFDTGTY